MFSLLRIRERLVQPEAILFAAFVMGLGLHFGLRVTQWTGILFLLAGLIKIIDRRSLFDSVNPPRIGYLLLPIYFVVCAASLIHRSPDFSWLERGWTLVFFPLMLMALQDRLPSVYRGFLKGFVAGALLVALVNLIIATARSIRVVDGELVFDSTAWGGVPFLHSIDHYGNFYFSEYYSYFLHPTYAALLTTASAAAVLILNPFGWRKRLQVAVIVFHVLVVGLLSSRAGVIGMGASLLVLVFASGNLLTATVRYVLLGISIIAIVIFALHPRVQEVLTGNAFNNPRIASWKAAVNCIEKRWIFGYGLDRAQEQLNEQYRRHGNEENLMYEYNAHNQLLETWLGTGITGALILLYIFFYGFRKTILNRDIFGAVVMLNLLIHFTFESMLHRYHGLIFLALFYPLVVVGSSVAASSRK
jgi:O-antigen ligase